MLSSVVIKRIDRSGRRILHRVGLTVHDEYTLKKLRAAGARVDTKNRRAYFAGKWLDSVLKPSPSSFNLYSRDGRTDLHLGGGRVHFGNGGRVFRVRDMDTGEYRPSLLKDVAGTAALVERLENVRFFIVPCQAHDLEQDSHHLNTFYRAFCHTRKHVMGGCDDPEGVEQVWRLASRIAGGEERLRERPILSVITNAVSPLTVGTDVLRILRFCCQRRIPVTCAPAPIAGATSPGTLAGTLAQMHAEALAGAAIAQVFAPGSPVMYGAVPAAMDMRKMEFSLGSVEMAMMNAAAVQLAALYRLPIYASAGVTDSKTPDVQAGSEKMLSMLLVALSGADYIHLAAGMLDSGNTISYEQYVIDDEIIGTVHRVLRGIRVDGDTLGFDVIRNVGPGGNYAAEDHTVDHMLEEFFYPRLSVRCDFDTWERQGRPDARERAVELAKEAVGSGPDELLDPALVSELRKAFPGIVDI
jgi:trimethylamine--corrinoid protein Co-methyltransferase